MPPFAEGGVAAMGAPEMAEQPTKRQKVNDGAWAASKLRVPISVVSNLAPSRFALFVDPSDRLQQVLGE